MSYLFETMGLHTFIDNLPGNQWFKDINLNYIACNDRILNIMQLTNKNLLLNNNDFNQPWALYANVYQKNDKKVIAIKKSCYFIHPAVTYQGDKILLLNKKTPFIDKAQNVIGILGNNILIKCKKFTNFFIDFHEQNIKLSLLNDILDQYAMIEDYSEFGLTNREGQCLFYFVRGKTSKEIAEKLNISNRTVETHIEHIKNKYNCVTKSNLIEKAIKIGFVNMMPMSVIKDLL